MNKADSTKKQLAPVPNAGTSLRLDWCSHDAAKYAVEHWHYSKTLSSSRNVYIGVWENDKYIGVIVFGIGSGNITNGTRYGLAPAREMAELTRVALSTHKTPVSRIIAIALKMVRRQSPTLRMIISMADPKQGHYGGIYQAGNWVYTGRTKSDVEYFCRGKWVHHRTATSLQSAAGLPSRPIPAKHRYLMPLDAEMKAKIEPLRKPYPKRATSVDNGTADLQSAGSGVIPTVALQESTNV